MVTIFGYSAPKSDSAAIEILKRAWGKAEDRNLEEIEIIDIREEDEVIESWQDFINTHHYSYHKISLILRWEDVQEELASRLLTG